jgi:Transglutaminase-like superfamily
VHVPLIIRAWWLIVIATVRREQFVSGAATRRLEPTDIARLLAPEKEQVIIAAAQEALKLANRAMPTSLSCLQRTIVLHQLLGARGVSSTPVIGVRTTGGKLEAHAWLERDGQILTSSDAHCARYHRLEHLSAP